MNGLWSRGKPVVTARVVAASGVTVGAVAWISVMTKMNPGSVWFWENDPSRTLYGSLETLFLVGVAAVAAHLAALVLILGLTSRRSGFWLGLATLMGVASMSGLALSGNPRLLFGASVLVPVVADGLAIILIGVAWRIARLRHFDQGTSMWPESTNLIWLEAATVVMPLSLVLGMTSLWLDFVFDEGMGPEDGGVAVAALFISQPALIWALVLVAVSRHRHRSGGSTRPS